MKRLLTAMFATALLLALFVLPAQADTHMFQDPAIYAEDLVEYQFTSDKDTHMQKTYTVPADMMEYFISNYVYALANDGAFEYLGAYPNEDYIYHCFGAVAGYRFDTFMIKSYGKKITPDCVIALQYNTKGEHVYLRHSKDLRLGERGWRLTDDPNYVQPTPIPTPVPTPTPIPTAVPVPTTVPTPRPTAVPLPTVRITPKPTQRITPTPVPQEPQSGYGYVTTNRVNLRSGAGTDKAYLRTMNRYDLAQVLGSTYAGGKIWYRIVQAGVEGYVMGDFFKPLTVNELAAFLASEEYRQALEASRATPTPRPTPVPTPYYPPVYYTPTPTPYNPMSNYGYVTTNSVRLRSGAGTDKPNIRMMNRYDLAQVLGSTYAGGKLWYHIIQAGTEGYVMGDFFKHLTVSELAQFLNSNEYKQSQGIIRVTPTPSPTPRPTYYPIYITPTPRPTVVPVPTTPPQSSSQVMLNVQDPSAYTRGAMAYNYVVNAPAYQQYCYKVADGRTADYVIKFVNNLIYTEPTLTFAGTSYSKDGATTYYSFAPRAGYNYKTFMFFQYGEPITPSCCLSIGYRDGLVYVLTSPNLSLKDEGYRY